MSVWREAFDFYLVLTVCLELGSGVLAEIGEKEGSRVVVKSGRFGMYINWKKVNAKMPSEYLDDPSELPLDEAWELIKAKAEATGSKTTSKKGQTESSVDLPPGPKRPLSAYFHFCADRRSEVAKTVSSLGETSKELARLWSETPENDRNQYHDLAKQSKKEYETKKAEWQEECKSILAKVSGTTSKSPSTSKKVESSVKRPRSAYVYFCASKRPEVSEKFDRLGDISKELARLWKETSAEDRSSFEHMSSEDKERYQREKGDTPTIEVPKPPSKKATRSTMKKAPSQPIKRAPSAYMLFCAANRNRIVDEEGNKLPLGETTKRLAKMWHECDESTKGDFMEQAEKQKAALV